MYGFILIGSSILFAADAAPKNAPAPAPAEQSAPTVDKTDKAPAPELVGDYMEARDTPVWLDPKTFEKSAIPTGTHAILGWRVKKGTFDGVKLDQRGIAAIIFGDKDFATDQAKKRRTLLLVDEKASEEQQKALVAMVKKVAGEGLGEVVAVKPSKFFMMSGFCDGLGCAFLSAGPARIETRCICPTDFKTGDEKLTLTPLFKTEGATAAFTEKCTYAGGELGAAYEAPSAPSGILATFSL